MVLHYYNGNLTYNVGEPECASMVEHRAWHYFFLYYMPVMSIFAVVVNTWIVTLLIVGDNGRKLLQQSQHVYVLGSAITNALVAAGGNLPLWLAIFVIPCKDIGPVICFLVNIINFAGGYQILFNVCLVCYDRWRLVKLGPQYSHTLEVQRARKFLCLTSALSLLAHFVPEIGAPLFTGIWVMDGRDTDDQKCQASQIQPVPQLGGASPGDIVCCAMIVIQWSIIVIFTLLTTRLLYLNMKRHQKIANHHKASSVASLPQPTVPAREEAAAALGKPDQLSLKSLNVLQKSHKTGGERKLLRATLIMFGMVLASLITFGPLAIVLALLEFDSSIITGWHQVQILLCLQWTSPALDPLVFAVTLPKLRARARTTAIGKFFLWLFVNNRFCMHKNRSGAGTSAENSNSDVGSTVTLPIQKINPPVINK